MKKPAFFSRSPLTEVLWSFRREFMLVGLFSAVANLLMLTPTIYMLQVYDHVLISMSELTLVAVSLICLFLFGVMAVSEWTRSRILVRGGVRLDEALGTRVFNSSFEAYLDSSGHSPQRAFSDLLQVRQFLTGQGIFAFFDAPWTPIYIVVMFMLHPLLGWAALFFAFIQLGVAWLSQRNTIEPSEAAVRSATETAIYLQGKLRNAEVLESMGMVSNLRTHWRLRQARYLKRAMIAQQVTGRVQVVSKFIRHTQQIFALAVGAVLVINGQLSIGAMIAANVLMTRALAPIDAMMNAWRSFFTAKAAFERLELLLRDYPERDAALRRVAPSGAVELRQVFATAPGRQEPILKDVSFQIDKGRIVGVVGPSGSGKSTLARVLLGIWPHVEGEVLLDGLPVTGWNRIELGPHVGYLPQDIELFEGTIAENIARFSQIDSSKVIAAATVAGLHSMILRMPAGYDTPIGEAGATLSGGQKQRIALARAVYGDPKFVVLDEPNANLDDAGEAALMQALAQMKARGTTVFLITHRPSALAAADWLILLRDGEVVSNGPREQVIASLHARQNPQPGGAPAAVPQPV